MLFVFFLHSKIVARRLGIAFHKNKCEKELKYVIRFLHSKIIIHPSDSALLLDKKHTITKFLLLCVFRPNIYLQLTLFCYFFAFLRPLEM